MFLTTAQRFRRLACLCAAALLGTHVALAQDEEPPAEKTYLKIDVLKGLPSSKVPLTMFEWSRALGVKCDHCHQGEEFENGTKPTHATARQMARMTAAVSASHLKAEGGVTCFSCHRGSVKPARLAPELLDAELKKWPEELDALPDERKLQMTVYKLSLGVECTHCHNAPQWRDATKPAHASAVRMATMFDEFPKHIPDQTGKLQCFSCHQGAAKVEKVAPRPKRPSQ